MKTRRVCDSVKSWSKWIWVPAVVVAFAASCSPPLNETRISRSARILSEALKDLDAIYNAVHEYVDLHNDVPRDRSGSVSFEPLLDHQAGRYLPLERDALANRYWNKPDDLPAYSIFCLNPQLTAKGVKSGRREIIVASRPGAFAGIAIGEYEHEKGPGEVVFILFCQDSYSESFTAHSGRYEKWFGNFSSEAQDKELLLNDREDLVGHLLLTEEEWAAWRNQQR